MAPEPNRPLRLVLVNDYEVIIEGLRAMVSAYDSRVEVVGVGSGDSDVPSLVREADADVVLLDVPSRGSTGRDVIEAVVGAEAPARAVVFTDVDDEQQLFDSLRRGATGYLLKTATAPQLVEALERVHAGEIVIDAALAAKVALAAARIQSGKTWPGVHLGLSQRESDVLSLLVEGMSNRSIAERLYVGEETVKSHLRSLYRKLGVRDRSQAIALALRERIVR